MKMSAAWITTNAYTIRPHNITPSYTGFIPQQRFQYGDTFGNTNKESFQKRRNIMLLSSVLKTHKEQSLPILRYPTVFSNDPTLVLAHRKRSRERWLAAEKYQLQGTRDKELETFLQKCQQHREYYQDHTGTAIRVDNFVLPRINFQNTNRTGVTEDNKQDKQYNPVDTKYASDYIRKRNDQRQVKLSGGAGRQRDRAIRDLVFENR